MTLEIGDVAKSFVAVLASVAPLTNVHCLRVERKMFSPLKPFPASVALKAALTKMYCPGVDREMFRPFKHCAALLALKAPLTHVNGLHVMRKVPTA